MLRQRTRTLQALTAATDAGATCLAFVLAYYVAGVLGHRMHGLLEVLPIERYSWMLLISVPMWWVLFALFGCYDISPIERVRDNLKQMIWPVLMGTAIIGASAFFSKELLLSRRVVGAFAIGNAALLFAGRALVLHAAPYLQGPAGGMRRVLIIGGGPEAKKFGDAIRGAGWGLELAGYVSTGGEPLSAECLGTVAELATVLDQRGIDDVVLAETGPEAGMVREIIRVCEEVGARLHIPSGFFAAQLSRPHLETFRGIPMLTFSPVPYGPVPLGIKRAVDIVGSIILGIVLAIPMLAIAIIIKATSRGPVLFSQRRSGLYGREFTMYKFRSMVVDAEARKAGLEAQNEMSGPVFKMKSDPRVTGFGGCLRRHSLDELPQLWNVFKGDMSLIGPRPPLPAEVAQYQRWQRRRLSMRPGLSCIWQVTDRNLAGFDKWMEYDLQYIDNWSLWLDFKIALKTVVVVFKGTGI